MGATLIQTTTTGITFFKDIETLLDFASSFGPQLPVYSSICQSRNKSLSISLLLLFPPPPINQIENTQNITQSAI